MSVHILNASSTPPTCSAKVGVLEQGHYADIVAVNGDPLSDVKLLESPIFVMKGGTVARQETGK